MHKNPYKNKKCITFAPLTSDDTDEGIEKSPFLLMILTGDILQQYAEEAMTDTTLFLVEIKANQAGTKFSVIIDGDTGVSIGQCAEISRNISKRLDEAELAETAFTFEVSSPGADLPLKLLRQYAKHTGRTLQVQMKDGKNAQGILEQVGNDKIVLVPEAPKGYQKQKKEALAGPLEINWSDIKETRVVLKFK